MNKNKKHYYWSELYFIGEDHLSKDLVENIETDPEYHEWCKEAERKMEEREIKENEMSLEDIIADNENRFRRAVEAYKDLAYVKCKEHLLEENLSKSLINRVSREFAIGTDLVRALLHEEFLKMSIIQNLKKIKKGRKHAR